MQLFFATELHDDHHLVDARIGNNASEKLKPMINYYSATTTKDLMALR